MPVCRFERPCHARHASELSTSAGVPLRGLARIALRTALLLGLATSVCQGQSLKVAGSGNGVAAMEVLAQAYRKLDPGFQLQAVPNLGSSGGLKALSASVIDFAIIGRALKSDESAQGLIAFEYGRTPLVLGSSRKEPGSISLQDVADLYAGRVSQWPDGEPVRIVLRPLNDSDTVAISAWSPAIKDAMSLAHARPGMIVAPTDRQSAEQLERLHGSLGTTTLAMILAERRDIRVLPIAGVSPSVKSLKDKTYPYFKRMFLVTRGQGAEHLAKFVAFVRSAEGRAQLERIGHLVPEK